MAIPGNFFSDSKAALFCGGTTFNNMIGTSKLIMDDLAYKNLLQFYMEQFENTSPAEYKNHILHRLNSVIQSFKAMIPLPSFSFLKEQSFSKLAKKITTFGLLKDEVMPAGNIIKTLKDKRGKIKFRVMFTDFPYKYTHENPFPIFKTEKSKLVDKSFDLIFSQIAFSLK